MRLQEIFGISALRRPAESPRRLRDAAVEAVREQYFQDRERASRTLPPLAAVCRRRCGPLRCEPERGFGLLPVDRSAANQRTAANKQKCGKCKGQQQQARRFRYAYGIRRELVRDIEVMKRIVDAWGAKARPGQIDPSLTENIDARSTQRSQHACHRERSAEAVRSRDELRNENRLMQKLKLRGPSLPGSPIRKTDQSAVAAKVGTDEGIRRLHGKELTVAEGEIGSGIEGVLLARTHRAAHDLQSVCTRSAGEEE